MFDLYLMTEKGYRVIKYLVERNYTGLITQVIIGEDKNLQNDFSNEIQEVCNNRNIKYSLRGGDCSSTSLFAIAISWRWLIKKEKNLIVIHDSLLPKYRGFSPLVNSLINGEKKIGVTAIYASTKYDRGDIIYQDKIDISYPIKIDKAIKIISECYINVVAKIFEIISKGNELPARKQIDDEATYSIWLDEENYHIDWNKSSEELKRFIDATGTPYSGAFTLVNNEKITILDVDEIEDVKIENRESGKIIFLEDGLPVVICGKGLLKLKGLVNRATGKSILPLNKFRIRFK